MTDARPTKKPGRQRTVRCPMCRGPAVYDETNAHRPFCSERCKMVDLGTWAMEGYAIPGEELPQPQEPGPENT